MRADRAASGRRCGGGPLHPRSTGLCALCRHWTRACRPGPSARLLSHSSNTVGLTARLPPVPHSHVYRLAPPDVTAQAPGGRVPACPLDPRPQVWPMKRLACREKHHEPWPTWAPGPQGLPSGFWTRPGAAACGHGPGRWHTGLASGPDALPGRQAGVAHGDSRACSPRRPGSTAVWSWHPVCPELLCQGRLARSLALGSAGQSGEAWAWPASCRHLLCCLRESQGHARAPRSWAPRRGLTGDWPGWWWVHSGPGTARGAGRPSTVGGHTQR